jgi:hypothetical protein
MADDFPMPGQTEFSAEEERAMREYRGGKSDRTDAAPPTFAERFNANPQGGYAAMRPSTNIEDDRHKAAWQQGIEAMTEKPLAEIVEKVIHPSSGDRFRAGNAPFTPPY